MNEQLAREFLIASQQLADSMLAQLQSEDPDTAQKVVEAFQRGETLVVSCEFGSRSCIELASRSDYNSTRRICSIPMEMPPVH